MKKRRAKIRKIIQISFAHYDDGNGGITYDMYALCNDGSLWTYNFHKTYWMPAHQTEIPQT